MNSKLLFPLLASLVLATPALAHPAGNVLPPLPALQSPAIKVVPCLLGCTVSLGEHESVLAVQASPEGVFEAYQPQGPEKWSLEQTHGRWLPFVQFRPVAGAGSGVSTFNILTEKREGFLGLQRTRQHYEVVVSGQINSPVRAYLALTPLPFGE